MTDPKSGETPCARLKAWAHWIKKEKYPNEDKQFLASDIEAVISHAEKLQERVEEAKAETAALIDFLRTEMDWEYFRAERLYGGKDDQEKETKSRENARQIGNFLKESGHGIAFLKDRDAWKQDASRLAALVAELSGTHGDVCDGMCDVQDRSREALASHASMGGGK